MSPKMKTSSTIPSILLLWAARPPTKRCAAARQCCESKLFRFRNEKPSTNEKLSSTSTCSHRGSWHGERIAVCTNEHCQSLKKCSVVPETVSNGTPATSESQQKGNPLLYLANQMCVGNETPRAAQQNSHTISAHNT